MHVCMYACMYVCMYACMYVLSMSLDLLSSTFSNIILTHMEYKLSMCTKRYIVCIRNVEV